MTVVRLRSTCDTSPTWVRCFRSTELRGLGVPGESASVKMLPAIRDPACTACAGPVVIVAWTQLSLLRHAGYGEAQQTRIEQCVTAGCGSARRLGVDSVNPRVAARA